MWTNFLCICVFLFLEDGIVMVIFGFNDVWCLELSRFLDL
jgi:hypothetical protein